MAGAFFVAVSVVIVFAAWLAGTGSSARSWVVAARDVPAGARLGPADLTTAAMTLPSGGAAALAYKDPAALVGHLLVAPLQSGELIQRGDLAASTTGRALRPVTVEVSPTDLTDLSIGSMLDVLVTDGSDPSSPTTVVAADCRVLDIGRPSNALISGATGAQVTIGVSTLAQVMSIVHAAHTGTLSVVAGEPGDKATPGPAGAAGGGG